MPTTTKSTPSRRVKAREGPSRLYGVCVSTAASRRPHVLDVLWGLVLTVVGVALFLGDVLGVPMSRPGIGAFVTIVGLLSLAVGLMSKVAACFWTEVSIGASLAVLGVFVLLRTSADAATLNLIVGVTLAVAVVVRMASLTEFKDVRMILLCSAAAQGALAAAVLVQSGALTLGWIAMVLGGMAVIDGVTIVAIGRR